MRITVLITARTTGRILRPLIISALSLSLPALGAATAHAATPAATGSSAATAHATAAHHAVRTAAVPEPASVLSHLSRPLLKPDNTSTTGESTNWSGYVAASGTYTSASASWTVPWIDCLSTGDGIESSWVGLDGAPNTSGTVEQTGTGINCQSGTPQYFAWWETFPANTAQEYSASVAIDDSMSATVTYEGSDSYDMVLTDHTASWTKTTVANGATGADNASAEVITEANSVNGVITHLPNYWVEPFTGSTIDGGTLQAANAQPYDMYNSANAVISATAAADSSGDFDVFYGDSTDPDAIYDCQSGETESEFDLLLTASGCTGPYGSGAPYVVNVLSLGDISGVYGGAYSVVCDSISSASGGSVAGGEDCGYIAF